MQPRRSLRLVAGALVLAAPLLSSCGFDKATDRVYTPAAGTNNRDGDVKVLSAAVVSAQPGSGTFIATLSNNTDQPDQDAAFDSLAGSGDWTDLDIADFTEVAIPYRGFVNLADGDGVPVSGDFDPGNMLNLTLTFGSGETATMNVPVVYACEEWAGLDTSVSATSSESPSASESPSPGEVPTESASASPTEEASAAADAYDCRSVLEEN